MKKYFKTGKGEYGEGDIFIGITVPDMRVVAEKFRELPLAEIKKLLESKIHEHRFTALQILVLAYGRATEKSKKKIVDFYLKSRKYINNWDLIDTSAPNIIGDWFSDKNRKVLYKLAKSRNVWDRRIAVVATYSFIKKEDFADTLLISEMYLSDEHDLIHKAAGWMLREAGKKSVATLEKFLEKNAKKMPRTMLRYAIEKFPENKRKNYLKK